MIPLARAFAETANAVDDAMLLVTPTGEILSANRAAIAAFEAAPLAAPAQLGDLIADEPVRLIAFLRQCSGTKESIPTVLAFKAPGWDGTREFRLDGALFMPQPGMAPLIRLRLRPKEQASRSFGLLARQVDELNREIERRRRYEAELSEAMRRQAALLRELQHRVRNTIQLFLGLLNREARRADRGEARFGELAARFHAVGFVQKQVGSSSADLDRVDVRHLVGDIVRYHHPATGGETEFEVDVERVELPVEVATPLALMLNECLAATRPRLGGWVEGHRSEAGYLVLSVAQDGAADAFSKKVRDPFIALLAAQLRGSMACEPGPRGTTIVVEFPIPELHGLTANL